MKIKSTNVDEATFNIVATAMKSEIKIGDDKKNKQMRTDKGIE